ncbi:MAG TPA: ATP/GTP-binding protein [Cytophagaceae bacterium]|jgi:sugar lactone lactonase YvrE
MTHRKFCTFFSLLILCSFAFKESLWDKFRLSKVWQTELSFKIPESVVYDKAHKVFYVSNINGEADAKDGNGFISKVTLDGKIESIEWIKGLDAPKGMDLYNGKLYIADNTKIIIVDVKKGAIVQQLEVKGAKFLNDVTVDDHGTVYISDYLGKKIYKLDGGIVSVFYENERLINPNGLLALKGEILMVDMGSGLLYRINYENKNAIIVADSLKGGDGIQEIGNGEYLISNWAGEINYVNKKGDVRLLLDTKNEKVNAADIEYLREQNLLLIPTFTVNSVLAYKLEKR